MGRLTITGLVKHFGPVRANDGIDASFATGEIHALLGENGAGKSTLIKILSGSYVPDDGEIAIDGRPVNVADAGHARELGIAVVHQHSTLIPRLSVLENVALQEGGLGRIDPTLATRLIANGRRLGFDLDPRAEIEYLSPGDRQRVEIARALMTQARFVLLDEPTAVLSPIETAPFFELLERLACENVGVVFVTHHLQEALAQSQKITVLRHGRTVAQIDSPADVAEGDLIRMVVGDAEFARTSRTPGRKRPEPTRAVISLRGVSGAPAGGRHLTDVDLDVFPGAVTGIAGVEGNGQRELAAALAGAWVPNEGNVELLGLAMSSYSPKERNQLIADIPDDHSLAVSDELSIWENLAMCTIAWEHPMTPRSKAWLRGRARELVERFDIRPPGIETLVGRLSGGNRRRVILARELSKDIRLAVLCFPTIGLDVKSAAQVRAWSRNLADRGVAVAYIGSDLGELLEISDQLAVMARGRLTVGLDPATATTDEIGALMLSETPLARAGADAT